MLSVREEGGERECTDYKITKEGEEQIYIYIYIPNKLGKSHGCSLERTGPSNGKI